MSHQTHSHTKIADEPSHQPSSPQLQPSASKGNQQPHGIYANTAPPKKFLCLKRYNKNWKEMPDREIHPNVQDLKLPRNKIQTSKYTLLTFFPINLYEQFSQLANVYFLVITFLQTIRAISISEGQPVMAFPLIVILSISAIKSVFEDYKRYKSDNEENNSQTEVFRKGQFVKENWKNIRVGDIVRVNRNDRIACDMIMLKSGGQKGLAYVETKNLDGETTLKVKVAHKEVVKYFNTNADLENASNALFEYDRPSPFLYEFKGTMKYGQEKVSLDYQNFLLRGCSLKNTDYVIGVTVYTGHETKIMLNSIKARPKRSTVEAKMSKQVLYIFLSQCVYCLFASLYYNIWVRQHEDSLTNYLHFDDLNHFIADLIIRLGNWILIFTNFVPISLLVTLELVRFFQAIVISRDKKMWTDDIKPVVQSSNLNEEIGQVEYVFSDKTGTLTRNQMVFKKLSVGGNLYGGKSSSVSREMDENVDFQDESFFDDLNSEGSQLSQKINDFVLAKALTHTVMVEEHKGIRNFSASSPDELCLISFAKFAGFEFMGINEDNVMTVATPKGNKQYKLLHVLEFNSDRKRMSVILEHQGRYFVYCKGADNIVLKRTNQNNNYITPTNQNLSSMANEGLRTLVYSYKEIQASAYTEWAQKYHEASTSMDDREGKMGKLQDEIESNLELLGATGIEDLLQEKVSDTIDFLIQAQIKVWVLTGDKVETARSIGKSCMLINSQMSELKINATEENEMREQFDAAVKKAENEQPKEGFYLIITGDAMHLLNDKTMKQFTELTKIVKTVLACRVSPKQKQEIVELVKKTRKCISLSIGDGANDVNMITAAHVGVGIKGKEGLQASRASDFAIGQFSHLKRLMFYYGRECYRRNVNVIKFNFYKNMILVLPQFWYGFMNSFSGQTLYDPWLYQLYNLFFAALPIIIYAVFDYEYKDTILLKYYNLYDLGRKNKIFTTRSFWHWVISGSLQALPISIFSYLIMSQRAISEDGYMSSFWVAGSMTFTLAVINANIKIIIMSFMNCVVTLFFVVGSIIFYYVVFIIYDNGLKTTDVYGTLTIAETSGAYWMGLLLIVSVTNFFDFAIHKYFDLTKDKPELNKDHLLPDLMGEKSNDLVIVPHKKGLDEQSNDDTKNLTANKILTPKSAESKELLKEKNSAMAEEPGSRDNSN